MQRFHYDSENRLIRAETWQGLRLLQEQQPRLHSLYLYEPGSYAPMARIDSDPKTTGTGSPPLLLPH